LPAKGEKKPCERGKGLREKAGKKGEDSPRKRLKKRINNPEGKKKDVSVHRARDSKGKNRSPKKSPRGNDDLEEAGMRKGEGSWGDPGPGELGQAKPPIDGEGKEERLLRGCRGGCVAGVGRKSHRRGK